MHVLHLDAERFHTLTYRNALGGGRSGDMPLPFFHATVDALPAGLDALVICSDLQGRVGSRLLGVATVDALVALGEQGALPPPAATGVLLAGDLYAAPKADERGASGDVTPVWDAFEERFRWVTGVLGNHDTLAAWHRARVLDGNILERDGLRIGGVSGIIGKPTKPMRKTEAAFTAALRAVLDADVVVLHEGPEIPERRLLGHPAVRRTLDQASPPPLVISGHCHWPTPFVVLPSTLQILNVDGRVIVLRPA